MSPPNILHRINILCVIVITDLHYLSYIPKIMYVENVFFMYIENMGGI